MNLKSVGFYREMPHGNPDGESIFDYINQASEESEKICSYLDNGIVYIVTPGTCNDVVNPDKGISAVPNCYTDGIWLWPGDLSYYVKNYGLRLPDEFIETMKEHNWEITVTLENLDSENFLIDGIDPFENLE